MSPKCKSILVKIKVNKNTREKRQIFLIEEFWLTDIDEKRKPSL